jgi:hypothetical protein
MKIILSIIFLLSIISVWTCDLHGQTGIMEENDLYISVDDKDVSGVTKEQFIDVIKQVDFLYDEEVTNAGKKLVFTPRWEDGTVNAFARQVQDTWEVHMFGGLARHPKITEDGFALVVCHEMGHHLGGSPRKKSDTNRLSWASNEGQADYWGAMKCLRRYFQKQGNNILKVQRMNIPSQVKNNCAGRFFDKEEQAICLRASMAGKSVASLFHSLRQLSRPLEFHTFDSRIVETTYDGHPMPQCRLDTFYSASLCAVPTYASVDSQDPNQGVCSRQNGHEQGFRPLCWYKP